MKETAGKKDSGFPITNVGNDRRGLLLGMTGGVSGMTEGGSFVGNDRRDVGNGGRGPFRMEKRDA